MNIDWLVAIVTFIVLVVFSFNYYTAFFVYQADLSDVAGIINERILDTIMVDSYSVPVQYNSTVSVNGQILYMDFDWSGGTKESARLLKNGLEQPCMFSGDRLYWQSDISQGENMFRLEFSDVSVPLNCDDSLTISGEVRATPWSVESSRMLSQSDLSSLSATPYNDYRNFIGVSRDLRIETDNGFTYGPLPPRNIDVFVFDRNVTVAETGEEVELRVFVW